MSTFVIVVIQPVIQVFLQFLHRQVNLFPERDLVKLIQNRFMEALANAIGLRVPYFGFRVFDFIQRKIKLIVMRFWPAAILESPRVS